MDSTESAAEFDAGRDRSERRARLLTQLGWITILPLALIAGLRIVAYDETPELIALNALSQWLYVPAWAVLLLAASLGRRALAAVATLVVVGHITWLDLPSLVAARQPAHVARGTRVRAMSANLLAVNRQRAQMLDEILAAKPDLLLLQELTPEWQQAIAESPLRKLLPHRLEIARGDAFGIGLYTRLPAQMEAFQLARLPALRALVQIGSRKLRVYNVHTHPPVASASMARWHAMFEQFAGLIQSERQALLVGGDLNATPHTRWYRKLLALGLRGAHEDRGRDMATTWPNGRGLLPPIRLDHLLVSRGLAVLDVREGEGRGSDHKPVIADLALLPE